MKIRKGKVWTLTCIAPLIASGVAMAGPQKDVQSAERDAYVKSAGHTVEGIADTAVVTSVDPLGAHRIAIYTVDGSHKDIWLVTTGESCPQPVLSGNRIVSLDADVSHGCRTVAIQTIDKRALADRLRMIEPRSAGSPDAPYAVEPATLRWQTMFQADQLQVGGRSR